MGEEDHQLPPLILHIKRSPYMSWALIEAPIPNAPEGKYISQIPSPTNLLTLASALKAINQKDIKLFNFLKVREPPIIKAANIVYNMGEATCMDFLYNYAYKYLWVLSRNNPKSKIFLIGYHPWLHMNELTYPNVIYTTPHYFEYDIITMVCPKHKFDKETQWPNAWELNDWDWMHNNVRSVTKGIRCTFRSSRGCPHNCTMCPVLQTYGKQVRRYSVEWTMNEIDILYNKYGVRQIGFLDDNLMYDRVMGKELLHQIIARQYKGLSLTFEEGLDVPTANDEELISLLKQAHFTHIKLGVESFNVETLKFINKPYKDPKLAWRAIELLQKYKLNPVCFICIGFPCDTEESIQHDVDILKKLKVKLRVQILWAYPGIDYQGKGLPASTLKKLQQDAMYGTNSCAWRKKVIK
jgi:radical SAM superfamily enzyme YgiQ (UPF0313 family)